MLLEYIINMAERPVKVAISHTAASRLAECDALLLVEMELYFSCLLRKQVRFAEAKQVKDHVWVNDKLAIRFRPVMTASCSVKEVDGKPPLSDFPIVKPDAYIPHWLKIDYRKGQWLGEFGY